MVLLDTGQLFSGRRGFQTSQGGIAVYTGINFFNVIVRDGKYEWFLMNKELVVPKNKWFHLGITWSPKGHLNVYINGKYLAKAIRIPYRIWHEYNAVNIQLAKPNNVMTEYGKFAIDEWYFWESSYNAKHMMDVYKQYKQGTYNYLDKD